MITRQAVSNESVISDSDSDSDCDCECDMCVSDCVLCMTRGIVISKKKQEKAFKKKHLCIQEHGICKEQNQNIFWASTYGFS